MTVCCYVFRKSKPITFKAGNTTLKAYRLVYSHNSGQEDWGNYSDSEWQKKESRKLKRLRANSYPLRPHHQFFVTFHSDTETMLDLWQAGPEAQKAWDDCNDMPGVWMGKLTKKKSGRGWDYHSKGMVECHVIDLISKAFLFIGQDPNIEDEETSEEYFYRLTKAQREDSDYKKGYPAVSNYWDRDSQMKRQRREIEVWGSNFWYYDRKTNAASAV